MYIENLIEMHSHIIPGIDDGAQDIETSLEMIEMLQKQGAVKIVLTPHYYSNEISLDDFLRQRDKAFNELLRELPSGSPSLIPAAEVYISDYLFNNESLAELCIGDTNYILLEHPFSSPFDTAVYDRLMNLYCDFKVKPILAHIERYKALMDGKYTLDDYIDMGCLTQSNINAFSEAPRSIRKKLLKFLEAGKIHFLGSDCHNLDTRAPDYEGGVKIIQKKLGYEYVQKLIDNANDLLA